jgi:hypothetical protein
MGLPRPRWRRPGRGRAVDDVAAALRQRASPAGRLARAMPGLRRPRRRTPHARLLPGGMPSVRRAGDVRLWSALLTAAVPHPRPAVALAPGARSHMGARSALEPGWRPRVSVATAGRTSVSAPPCSLRLCPARPAHAATSPCGHAPRTWTSATSKAAARPCTKACSTAHATGRAVPGSATSSAAATAASPDAGNDPDAAAGGDGHQTAGSHHPSNRDGPEGGETTGVVGGRVATADPDTSPDPRAVRVSLPASYSPDSANPIRGGLSDSGIPCRGAEADSRRGPGGWAGSRGLARPPHARDTKLLTARGSWRSTPKTC